MNVNGSDYVAMLTIPDAKSSGMTPCHDLEYDLAHYKTRPAEIVSCARTEDSREGVEFR